MTTYDAQHRNEAVLRVLRAAAEPMAPTDIARAIDEPWCCPFGPCSAPISPVLKRIGAVRGPKFGTWTAPAA